MKQIMTLLVADQKVVPAFFSTIDSIFFYNDKESVKDEKLMVV